MRRGAVDNGLDLSVALGRDDGGDVSGYEVGQDRVGVVALSASTFGSGLARP